MQTKVILIIDFFSKLSSPTAAAVSAAAPSANTAAFARRALVGFLAAPAAASLAPAAGHFVHRCPSPARRLGAAAAAPLVALLNVPRLPFLLGRIFCFTASWHSIHPLWGLVRFDRMIATHQVT